MNTLLIPHLSPAPPGWDEPDDVDVSGAVPEGALSLALSKLRERLLVDVLHGRDHGRKAHLLRLAALEAESQVWLTAAPLLLFPLLFEEKVRWARHYAERQNRLNPAALLAASAHSPE